MVHLYVFRSAARGNGPTNLGLPIFGRQQSELQITCVYFYSFLINFRCFTQISFVFSILQILFRVSLTLLLQHKDEILENDDIATLAPLFRTIVKNANVTNCHAFIENIFRYPGTLKRETIERFRTEVAAKTPIPKRKPT